MGWVLLLSRQTRIMRVRWRRRLHQGRIQGMPEMGSDRDGSSSGSPGEEVSRWEKRACWDAFCDGLVVVAQAMARQRRWPKEKVEKQSRAAMWKARRQRLLMGS